MTRAGQDLDRARHTRRQFLIGGAAAGAGAAAALGATRVLDAPAPASAVDPVLNGAQTIPFYGDHQAGIATPAQAHSRLVALDLRDGVDRDGLRRLMRLLSDDAGRLAAGSPALADTEPELASVPARLTVTFGFGPGFVARAGGSAPEWLRPLPTFAVDRLRPEFSDGDLLLQVAADDPVTVAHATRMLLKDARSFAAVRWMQRGFRWAHGSTAAGTTMRNLFGQVDGTSNPVPGSEEFDRVVWAGTGWLAGGTGLVARRIHMDLEGWDQLDPVAKEASVGRKLSNGAPLTGTEEHDQPDFAATTPLGFPRIAEFSHVRRARGEAPGSPAERIFRRGYNYDDEPTGGEISNSGLIFVSYQADIDRQFVPIQRRLDELDLLNRWTTPVGSAVFAVPPGCWERGFIGETLLG
ncbi:peroxidase [Sinomonas cyclohexanicum]|uniref:Peroxidase n=1 Tax=Sinomonas cyclohexanicum TaxID=322009 RepID=A0ABM7PRL0_SINCY|nr:Dyp-type peroxidase [Corynebacterium cyclohexanicum]BCT74825.1 peroxidase [Corynebacterium cyclohexanicum]